MKNLSTGSRVGLKSNYEVKKILTFYSWTMMLSDPELSFSTFHNNRLSIFVLWVRIVTLLPVLP